MNKPISRRKSNRRHQPLCEAMNLTNDVTAIALLVKALDQIAAAGYSCWMLDSVDERDETLLIENEEWNTAAELAVCFYQWLDCNGLPQAEVELIANLLDDILRLGHESD